MANSLIRRIPRSSDIFAMLLASPTFGLFMSIYVTNPGDCARLSDFFLLRFGFGGSGNGGGALFASVSSVLFAASLLCMRGEPVGVRRPLLGCLRCCGL